MPFVLLMLVGTESVEPKGLFGFLVLDGFSFIPKSAEIREIRSLAFLVVHGFPFIPESSKIGEIRSLLFVIRAFPNFVRVTGLARNLIHSQSSYSVFYLSAFLS